MSRVLVDTSVWVSHFRSGNPELKRLLALDEVSTHPWVWGELACGTPPDRANTLKDLRSLAVVKQATLDETLDFVERERLFGLGCGWVDMQLLASTLLTSGTRLWTLDRRLAALAARLGVSFAPSTP